MVSANVVHLRENGPSAHDELPNSRISAEDRLNGVWSLSPKGTGGGSSSGNTAGQLHNVYYLRGEHDPEAVVEKWAEVNKRNISKGTTEGIRRRLRRQGSEFHDAVDSVVPRGESA